MFLDLFPRARNVVSFCLLKKHLGIEYEIWIRLLPPRVATIAVVVVLPKLSPHPIDVSEIYGRRRCFVREQHSTV